MKSSQTISKKAPRPPKVANRKTTPTAATPGGGKTPGELVRSNNRWRENYNPLRGLVLQKVVQLLEAGERGEFADLQWLYRFVEKRFPVLRALILRRRAALLKFDWDIKIMSQLPAGATKQMAEAQQKFLRGRYELISNLREAIKFLALAEFRGFSVLQKRRIVGGKNDGAVNQLYWLPHWNIVRDGLYGDWFWNPEAMAVNAAALPADNRIASYDSDEEEQNGLPRADFIIREVDMPVNEIAVIAFLRSNLSQKDWDAFIEIVGIPGCVVIMPANIPPGKEDDYRAAAEKVAEGASGSIPNGGDAKFPTASFRGNAPFKDHLEWQEKDVVLAGTGGKLAMLTAATGLNSQQAEVHDKAFEDVAGGEGKEISEVFQCQFDKPELEEEFPGRPICVYFELAAQNKEDATVVTDRVQKLEQVGLQTDAAEVSEKVGLKLTRVAAPSPANVPPDQNPADQKTKFQNRARRIVNAAKAQTELDAESQRQFLSSLAADLQPLAQRLEAILQIQDPAIMEQRLKAFYDEIDSLKADITADPAAAHALLMINATQFANAAAAAAAKRKVNAP